MTAPTLVLAPELRAMLAKHADRLDLDLIERALRFSTSAHHGQKRRRARSSSRTASPSR